MERHMSKPKEITHYCVACNRQHTFIEDQFPFWYEKKIKSKTVYYCNKGIDCAGCHEVHARTGVTHTIEKDGETYWICNKWFKKTGNGTILWENWSPQEVMSGVHLGMDRVERYGRDTEDHSIVQGAQVQALEESLDEIEGY